MLAATKPPFWAAACCTGSRGESGGERGKGSRVRRPGLSCRALGLICSGASLLPTWPILQICTTETHTHRASEGQQAHGSESDLHCGSDRVSACKGAQESGSHRVCEASKFCGMKALLKDLCSSEPGVTSERSLGNGRAAKRERENCLDQPAVIQLLIPPAIRSARIRPVTRWYQKDLHLKGIFSGRALPVPAYACSKGRWKAARTRSPRARAASARLALQKLLCSQAPLVTERRVPSSSGRGGQWHGLFTTMRAALW